MIIEFFKEFFNIKEEAIKKESVIKEGVKYKLVNGEISAATQ